MSLVEECHIIPLVTKFGILGLISLVTFTSLLNCLWIKRVNRCLWQNLSSPISIIGNWFKKNGIHSAFRDIYQGRPNALKGFTVGINWQTRQMFGNMDYPNCLLSIISNILVNSQTICRYISTLILNPKFGNICVIVVGVSTHNLQSLINYTYYKVSAIHICNT